MRQAILCATLGLGTPLTLLTVQVSQVLAQPKSGGVARPGAVPMGPANFVRGQIVNFNPQANAFTLRTGTGAAAREQQFRFDKDSRFFGPDRRAIADAMRFDGFRNGADVWFQPGAGGRANFIHDMRLFNPSDPVLSGRVTRGEIVSVDPATGMITIRSGEGSDVHEHRFHVNRETRFFDRERLALEDGLAYSGFGVGTPVWYAPGAGALADTLAGVSLADPAVATADIGPGGAGPAGPTSPGRYARGVVVSTDPKGKTLNVNVGEGSDERQVALNVSPDARFFGADHRPLSGGLAFRGFRAGADVWFQTSSGDLSGPVTTLSLFDPYVGAELPGPAGVASSQAPAPDQKPIPSKYVAGKVVAVDTNNQTITIKTGAGDDASEHTYKIVIDTLFFGPQRQPVQEGLRYDGLRPGADVWLRVGTGEVANTVRDLRMYDPSRSDKDR
jgi:hypothetical protein